MKKIIFFFSALAIVFSACHTNKSANKSQESNKQMVGNDKDSHGCIASAGYRWSEIKSECVQIFTAGTAFDPVKDSEGTTLVAYVILDKDKTKAEVFIPGKDKSVILNAVQSQSTDDTPIVFQNKSEKIEIVLSKDTYYIQVNGTNEYMQKQNESNGLGTMLLSK